MEGPLDSIENDPWGRPSKLVLEKLRPYASSVTEILEDEVLENILSEVFPGGPGTDKPQEPTLSELTISAKEVLAAARKGKRRKAPGLDGIPGVVVRAAKTIRAGNCCPDQQLLRGDPSEYGFRTERSTVDAVLDVKNFVEESARVKKVVTMISLDISNAFNSLPWAVIVRAMEHKNYPR
ncbi:uncharacterized protein LOC118445614 [Vespa mandarinia]|uniref:uncharacterized protein LOC118445614 n=1 Tax=Vespa mandarinia TaxID=7446 RepID=UPI001615A474|nr:uncharacterized protein LOC118445614 [Vespa mandarinia]